MNTEEFVRSGFIYNYELSDNNKRRTLSVMFRCANPY